jgi:hypothetical protein
VQNCIDECNGHQRPLCCATKLTRRPIIAGEPIAAAQPFYGSIACAADSPTSFGSRVWYTEAIVAAAIRSRPAMDCARRTLDAG